MWIGVEQKKIRSWAKDLSSVHPHLEADMPYVLEAWEKEMNCEHDVFEEMHKQFQEEMKADVQVANPVQAPATAQTRVESPKFPKRNYNDDSGFQLLQNARRVL